MTDEPQYLSLPGDFAFDDNQDSDRDNLFPFSNLKLHI